MGTRASFGRDLVKKCDLLYMIQQKKNALPFGVFSSCTCMPLFLVELHCRSLIRWMLCLTLVVSMIPVGIAMIITRRASMRSLDMALTQKLAVLGLFTSILVRRSLQRSLSLTKTMRMFTGCILVYIKSFVEVRI